MELARYVGTLNLLGDENRLRLCALLRERELTVSDLVRVTGISQSRVSTHLGRLREGGFVRDRRDGQHAFYALAEGTLRGAAKLVLEEASRANDPILVGDRERLAELGRFPESVAGEMERHYSPGRTWQSLAAGLAALLELGDVLDVGSGDGAAASFLAPRCRSLTCVDTSARMVAAARRRLGKTRAFRAAVADGASLPFPDASFDAALLFHTLTYVEDPGRVVVECARVLRPGGRLVVLSLDRHEHRDLTAAYGERRAGFSPAELKKLLARARLTPAHATIACREAKKPHFRTVLAIGNKT